MTETPYAGHLSRFPQTYSCVPACSVLLGNPSVPVRILELVIEVVPCQEASDSDPWADEVCFAYWAIGLVYPVRDCSFFGVYDYLHTEKFCCVCLDGFSRFSIHYILQYHVQC